MIAITMRIALLKTDCAEVLLALQTVVAESLIVRLAQRQSVDLVDSF